jgi:cytochrome c-type biogenesis protein
MEYVMQQLVAAGSISPFVYLLVLLAGVASALSPCFVPVLAMFGGYVGGYAKEANRQPTGMAIAFTLGQALTLAIVGVVAVLIGRAILSVFTGYELDRYIPAVIGIVMGLKLLGVLKFDLPLIGRLKARRPSSIQGAFTLGIPFGLVVTPCTIPIFLLVVSYVAVTANIIHGALLMVAYALGRGGLLRRAYQERQGRPTHAHHREDERGAHPGREPVPPVLL